MSALSVLMAVIRALPPIERWVAAMFLGYKAWRAQYDAQIISKAIQQASLSNDTTQINSMLGKSDSNES